LLDPLNTGARTLDGRRACQETIKLWRSNPMPNYHAVQNIVSTQVIPSNANVSYKAGTEIELIDGFHAKPGSIFSASIEELEGCGGTQTMSSSSNDEQNKDNVIQENNFLSSQNQASYKINLLPNPNNGTFQIETNFLLTEVANLKITNTFGIPVYETQNLVSNTFQLPNSASGLYFVIMIMKDGTVLTQKMMLR
jgi:hypothetical protein